MQKLADGNFPTGSVASDDRPWRGWDELSPVLHLANFYDAGKHGDFGPRFVQEFQIVFVQAGRGSARVDRQQFDLSPGDLIFYGPRQRHEFHSRRDDPLQLIGMAFLFCREDRARYDASQGHARPEPFVYPKGKPRCPLNPRPPTKVSCGPLSAARRHCESLVLSFLSEPRGRELEKRGLMLMLFQAWHEAIHQASRPSPLSEHQRRVIEQVQQKLMRDLLAPPTPEQIAAELDLSADHLARLFKKQTGVTIREFVSQQRLMTARRMLVEGRLSVKQIAHEVGFEDALYFSRRFTKQFGAPPSELRRTGRLI